VQIEERYGKLINYLTDYIYSVRIDDGVAVETHHGPGCVNVTGYTSEDYDANPDLWYDMVPDEDRPRVLEQAQLAVAGTEIGAVEHRIKHRDGSIRWIRNKIVVSKDDEGHPIAYDGLITDITQLKRVQARESIKTQQLIQADKMASLGILVSGIAHEISNPNNFILLNAKLFHKLWKDVVPILDEYRAASGDFSLAGMSYDASKEKLSQSIDGILVGSERIQSITRSLTEYARSDSGNLNERVEINKVVEMAILLTRNLIRKSTSQFHPHLTSELPVLRGNVHQLEQVVINLISNACQSLRTTEEAVHVSTFVDYDRDMVIVEVKDEGSGIKEGDLKYIMDPFFTTKRNSGGTGLGLSVSYNIVKSHGGTLVLESEEAKGTVARVAVPVDHSS
jgi:PAS domain S-box-containing protein